MPPSCYYCLHDDDSCALPDAYRRFAHCPIYSRHAARRRLQAPDLFGAARRFRYADAISGAVFLFTHQISAVRGDANR